MHRSCRWLASIVLALAVLSPAPVASASPSVQISRASEQTLHTMLAVSGGSEPISRQFLGTSYGANTLVGSATEPERLVVELQRVDCFTYADYTEALKRADSRDEFIESLIDIRYKNGVVGFASRKHFFTDWSASSPAVATDVTAGLSDAAVEVTKNLNGKDSGGVYLPGLPTVPRTMSYLPAGRVDAEVVSRLHTGDYVGAYADDGGLDVTHVGIYINSPTGPVFRNASSRSTDNRVVDTPLFDYLQTVPGVVVLRPVI